MAAYDTVVTVFKVVTIIMTLMMRVSLLPDWNRWRKNRKTADMSVLPCVMIFGNSYCALFYAYAIGNYLPLFATSMLGVIVGIFMAYSFYRWATTDASFCWGVYGGLIHNNFLLIPSIIGVTLSLTQMLVTFVYRSKGANDALLSEDLVDVVVCSGEQNQSDDTDCKKKTDFVALRSPGRENAQTAAGGPIQH
ncbi:hypothetical protein PI124_g17451 [Phytophthora idaei]|nr:hypothetical protein PI125_g5260 [Phytophthora idaei]KAG3164590.1 hypothetical protein PI126_g5055 [Phytophthora idaei]KAG3237560.1 hypothetical protein PI124_g17451 [Phytophthora idaei]